MARLDRLQNRLFSPCLPPPFLTASSLSPPCRHSAATLRANQPLPPFRHWRLWSIPAGLLGWVRFTPVTTSLTPDHKPELGRGGAFERHRRASVGFHG